MATVFDVAAYILSRRGPMSHMKLQKLLYYAQAWSLVWDETPLFPEPVKPTKRTLEMLQFYFAGWASDDELPEHIDELHRADA